VDAKGCIACVCSSMMKMRPTLSVGTEKFVRFRQVFGLHRFKLHRYLVDETVKSVWIRQVFGLLRVRFRQVSLYKIWSSMLEIKTMAMLQMENGHIMLITHNIYYTKTIE
jgi:hypothetical protein